MKQNLQPPATPLEMLSLFFPAGLLDYFDLVNHVSQETCFIFWVSGFSWLVSFLLSV